MRSAVPSVLSKVGAIFLVYLKDNFAYPASTVLWVLADAQAAIILPAVWVAAAGVSGTVAGFDRGGIVSYYLVSMALAQFITSHLMWDIAWDIREGFFSSQIVRPIDYFVAQSARNVAWRITKLIAFLPLYMVVFLAYSRLVSLSPIHFDLKVLLAILLAQQLSFTASFFLAMVTLWTTEFESLLRSYYIPELVLSGRLIPLASMPLWVGSLGNLLHFKYTNSFPTQMMLGQLSSTEIGRGLWIQLGWSFGFVALGRLLYLRGSRRYTGVGM